MESETRFLSDAHTRLPAVPHDELPSDLGVKLPHLCLLAVGAVPGRCEVWRQTDDGSGDAHVGVVYHHQQVQAPRQAQLRPTDHVNFPPGSLPFHPRTGGDLRRVYWIQCGIVLNLL